MREIERTCLNCKHEDKAGNEFPCSCCIHNAIDKFEPKPKETNGWIPCSEMPPEDDTLAYVTTIHGETAVSVYGDGMWLFEEGGVVEARDYVVAYMPLPEPYKEGLNRE